MSAGRHTEDRRAEETPDRGAGPGTASRRAILGAGLGTTAFCAIFTQARRASAGDGDPLLLGTGNTATAPTRVRCDDDDAVVAWSGAPSGVAVTGQSDTGTGVRGSGGRYGIVATSDHGTALKAELTGDGGGPAVVAIAGAHEIGLQVSGLVRLVDRSGVAVIRAGRRSVRVRVPVYGDERCFATLMNDRQGVHVQSTRADPREVGGLYIYLNKSVPADTRVAWLIIN